MKNRIDFEAIILCKIIYDCEVKCTIWKETKKNTSDGYHDY